MSPFVTYIIGFIILIVGLAIGAHLLGAPPIWIGVGVIVLLGIAVLTASTRTGTDDPSRPDHRT